MQKLVAYRVLRAAQATCKHDQRKHLRRRAQPLVKGTPAHAPGTCIAPPRSQVTGIRRHVRKRNFFEYEQTVTQAELNFSFSLAWDWRWNNWRFWSWNRKDMILSANTHDWWTSRRAANDSRFLQALHNWTLKFRAVTDHLIFSIRRRNDFLRRGSRDNNPLH
jgi:hypothetical protein